MRAAWILTLVLGWSASLAQAQSRHTVSGYITDASSGETLIGATVWVESMSEGGETTVTLVLCPRGSSSGRMFLSTSQIESAAGLE